MPTERVDTWEMALAHRAFRQQFRLLPGLIRGVAAGDRERAAVVAERLTDITNGLHHHHTAEDDLLWPVLLSRVTPQADLVHRMEAQHARLDGLLRRIDEATARWRPAADADAGAALATLVTEASAALDEHLTDEENQILPLVEEHITQAEWDALNARAREVLPKNAKALVFLGIVLDQATPAESVRFLGQLPPPVRWAWRLFGTRVHAKAKARLLRAA